MLVKTEKIAKLYEAGFGISGQKCYLMDQVFNTISEEEVAKILKEDHTDRGVYTANLHDCDNFAIELLRPFSGYAFGLAIVKLHDGGLHAINTYVNENMRIKFIEPQTDEHVKPGQDFKNLLMVIMG